MQPPIQDKLTPNSESDLAFVFSHPFPSACANKRPLALHALHPAGLFMTFMPFFFYSIIWFFFLGGGLGDGMLFVSFMALRSGTIYIVARELGPPDPFVVDCMVVGWGQGWGGCPFISLLEEGLVPTGAPGSYEVMFTEPGLERARVVVCVCVCHRVEDVQSLQIVVKKIWVTIRHFAVVLPQPHKWVSFQLKWNLRGQVNKQMQTKP